MAAGEPAGAQLIRMPADTCVKWATFKKAAHCSEDEAGSTETLGRRRTAGGGMMMTRQITKAARVTAAVTCIVLVGLGTGASANDSGGLAEFFNQQFGLGAPQPQPQTAPMWSEDNPYDRPLVVRPHHRRAHVLRAVAVIKGPVAPVSIYEDKTLRRGDAVMTAHGIRIFRGSSTLPYKDADFVAISASDELSRDVAKTLTAMDHVPRS